MDIMSRMTSSDFISMPVRIEPEVNINQPKCETAHLYWAMSWLTCAVWHWRHLSTDPRGTIISASARFYTANTETAATHFRLPAILTTFYFCRLNI